MPIYEYVCLDCGKRFEALRSMRDADASIECQKCASARTARNAAVKVATGGRSRALSAAPSSAAVAQGGGGCGGCSGGSCGSCRH